MAFRKAYEIDTPEARKALCESFQGKIRGAKKYFQKDFDRMLEDMSICRHGAPKNWARSDNYRVNVTRRMVKQKISALYAKNPRAVAKRRLRMEYKYWDGSETQLMEIMQMAQTGDPVAMMYMQDIIEGQNRKTVYDRIGRTLETLITYAMNEQHPSLKKQMKRAVASAVQAGVGYIKLGFQREMDLKPQDKAKIADHAARLRHIETLTQTLQDGESGLDPQTAKEAEELRQAIASLQASEQMLIREGLTFDYAPPTSLIIDPACTNLISFVDAGWIAEELFLTPDDVKEYFNIDLQGAQYASYKTSGTAYKRNPNAEVTEKRVDMACCWVMYHKPSGMVYTMIDGYEDFVIDPEPPEIELERFFPVYALVLDQMEAEELYPLSDVRNMLPQQMELNRSRHAIREHRKANRPGYLTPHGLLSDEDKDKLVSHDANEVVELQGVDPGRDLKTVLQEIPKQSIDPNLYETSSVIQDIFLTIGAQEATFGGTSNSTATESSIAESNRMNSLEEDVDTLNDFLSDLIRDAGQVLLMNMSEEGVREIVGPGAVWPNLTRDQVSKELFLDIVAGSNGRPNKVARQQTLQQLAPILTQIPGIRPDWLAKQAIESVDDAIDLEEAYADGLPSIQMINAQAKGAMAGGGDPSDPEEQGPEGEDNEESPPEPAGSAQPGGGNNMMMGAPGAGWRNTRAA